MAHAGLRLNAVKTFAAAKRKAPSGNSSAARQLSVSAMRRFVILRTERRCEADAFCARGSKKSFG
jgi:hypothetical protein